jgi:hypothetical protein
VNREVGRERGKADLEQSPQARINMEKVLDSKNPLCIGTFGIATLNIIRFIIRSNTNLKQKSCF